MTRGLRAPPQPALGTRVALAAVKGEKTWAELAGKFGLDPSKSPKEARSCLGSFRIFGVARAAEDVPCSAG